MCINLIHEYDREQLGRQYPKVGLDHCFIYGCVEELSTVADDPVLHHHFRSEDDMKKPGSEMPVVSGNFKAFGVDIQCRHSLIKVHSEWRQKRILA